MGVRASAFLLPVGAILLACCAPVRLQPESCTAPPGAPASVAASLIHARPGATPEAPPSEPAVLEVKWAASVADPAPTGNAPVAYVIEAGTAFGASNVAVLETEGTEFTYSAPIANGTYYVRVRAKNACGTGPPSPDIVAAVTGSTATGTPNTLVLLETVWIVSESLWNTTFIRVMGRVRNGWRASEASFVEVTATFEGPTGEVAGTASTYVNGVSRRLKASRIVTDTVLEPAATGCFLVFADFPATVRVPSVELVVTSSDTYETEPLRGRVTVEGAISRRADAFGDLTASGQVKNTGDRLTYFTEIWMEATDAEGRLLDCGATSVEGSSVVLDRGVPRTGLAPAEVGVFENFTEAVFASVNRLRYWINWDEPEQQQPIPATARYWELKERLAAASATHEGASSPRERAELRDGLRREIRSIEQRLTQP